MLEKDDVIVWVEERLYPIWTVDCSIWNVLCWILKKLWTIFFFTSKSILFFVASKNDNETNVSTTLQEVVMIVWVEKRLDSIWNVDCSISNVLCGIRKNFCTVIFLHQ